MKTKELIQRLNEADPGGDAECCINNHDILYVESMPAWYDGKLEILDRDKSIDGYNVIGARVVASGQKIKIHSHSIEDMIGVSHKLPVDLSDIKNTTIIKAYEAMIEQFRKDAIAVKHDAALWSFRLFIEKKVKEAGVRLNESMIEGAARTFFDNNLSDDDAMPADICEKQLSWTDRRHMQWDRELSVSVTDSSIEIKRA